MGLLEHVAATSLDQDYAAVSQRREAERAAAADGGPGSPGRRVRSPGPVALAALAVFGLLVATAAVRTERTAEESASSRQSLVAQADAGKARLEARRTALASLQGEVARLRSRNLTETAAGQALQQRLERLRLAAGGTAVRGPGVRVRLDDAPDATSSREQVQAPDLQRLVNALWVVGAEAVSVNGQRVTSLTSIRDAAGSPTVNFRSLRAPYVVSAIGDRATMGAALLDTEGGQTLLALESTLGLRFDVESVDTMVLPAASRLSLRHAREGQAEGQVTR